MQVRIGGIANMPEPAKKQFEECVGQYARRLLEETHRLEAVNKSTTGEPEVTSTHVHDADTLLRLGHHKPQRSWRMMLIHAAAYVATLLSGYYYELMNSGKGKWIPPSEQRTLERGLDRLSQKLADASSSS
jgi:hypothetical protein